jgi:ABC-type branched-subunit amino acid transport system substrate-binding protein
MKVLVAKRTMAAVLAAALLAACGSTVSPVARQAAQSGRSGDLVGSEVATGTDALDAATGVAGTGAIRDGAGGTSGGRVTTRAGAASTGGGRGTGSTTGPIEIGIVRTAVSNASAFGVSLGNTVTEANVNDALVASFNEKGGIAGRRIVPVYFDTDTASRSWSADFEAACAKFTQDHHVVAVLGYVFNHDDGFEECLTKKGVPHLSTTFNVPDTQVLAQYPLLVALATPRIERRSLEKVDGALATGVLTKASKLGVAIDSCPGTGRAWTKVTKPYLLSKGINIVSEFEVGCADGSGDVGAEAGRAGSLVLQFRTAGVDTIAAMTVSESGAVLIAGNAAEAQGWHPKFIVSSLATTAVLTGQMPASQLANVHGYGWLPVMDVSPDRWPSIPPSAQRCIATLKDKGIKLSAPADYAFAFNICDAMFVYEAALRSTGGRTDGQAVVRAVEALGSSHPGALTLDGRLTFGPTRHDAPTFARYFAWDTSCSCFTYRSYSFTFD